MIKRKITSLFLGIAMLCSMLVPVHAQTDINITFAAQKDGAFIFVPQSITVADGIAEDYGYSMPQNVDYPTFFDALVEVHKEKYGAAFTKETAKNYLDISESGWLTKAFNNETTAVGYYINAVMVTTANIDKIANGDAADFYFYADAVGYSDIYTHFDSYTKTVKAGEQFELTLSKVTYAAPDYAAKDLPVDGTDENNYVTVNTVKEDGSISEPLKNGDADIAPDKDGKISLKFENEGTYIVTAQGFLDGAASIVAPVCIVNAEKKDVDYSKIVSIIYNEFAGNNGNTYSASKTPLVFPLEYDGETYTNFISYLKAWGLKNTGYEPQVNFTPVQPASAYTDWRSGEQEKYIPTAFDENGEITQNYYKDNEPYAQRLSNVSFTIGNATSKTIASIYGKTTSLIRSDSEIVEYVAANIPFARIKGQNNSADEVVSAVGETNVSGAVGALPTADTLYSSKKASVSWFLDNVSGKTDALKLDKNKITVVRPNVGEENAVFNLTANIKSKTSSDIEKNVVYKLTVPAFEAVVVPIKVTKGASLSITDKYYKAAADSKYIVLSESDSDEEYDTYLCTLHTNATGGEQKFDYKAVKGGYVSKSGTLAVDKNSAGKEIVIDMTASSENDTKLKSLKLLTLQEDKFSFNPDIQVYNVDVNGAQYVKIGGAVLTDGAKAKITSYYKTAANANKNTLTTTGTALNESGVLCYLPDAPGKYSVKIEVSAPEGSTQEQKTREYEIIINKTAANGLLSKLTLTAESSGNGAKDNLAIDGVAAEEKISPEFASGAVGEVYKYTVNYFRDRVKITPTAAGCNISVNGNTVASGKASEPIDLNVGDNEITVTVSKGGAENEYKIIVHRKAELVITDVEVENGRVLKQPVTDGSERIGSYSFASDADTIKVTYHTNITDGVKIEVALSGKVYEGIPGEAIELPVSYKQSIIPVTRLTRDVGGVKEGQTYVISFYRMAADAPSDVLSYLPAPGQFVNDDAFRNPKKTLSGSGLVTLGAYGGNIVYKYDEPIKNDPKNPYGIDFIVVGNCFINMDDGSTSSGAAEPAAVMVSADGENWYELAGSEYYTAAARHNLSVTYTNTDTNFAGAVDIPWVNSDGENGVMPKNDYHKQPYYPNPEIYGEFQNGTGKNDTYTAESVSFSGTMIDAGFYPFGYADSHAEGTTGNAAINPYIANHDMKYNGDGFDISWAVDNDGNPVTLDEISYIKIYNPTLSYGTATGEKSPEIGKVMRAKPSENEVGKSTGLAALKVNGTDISLEEGRYVYEADVAGAGSFEIVPTASDENANIYVSNQRVVSGKSSRTIAAVDKLRIIVQENEKEPAIYILNIKNAASGESNADLESVTLTPGDDIQTPDSENKLNFSVENGVSAVNLAAVSANKNAVMTLSGGRLSESIALSGMSEALKLDVGENVFKLNIKSADGTNEKEYILIIVRKSSSSTVSSDNITVTFTLTGDKIHYDADSKTYTSAHTSPVWIETSTVTVPKNSTVKYLTEMMLNNAGIKFVSNGKYISEINGIGEFDNGAMSGWMYRQNGIIVNTGYADKKLSQGDKIVWFYTDDYTKEKDYEDWNRTDSGSSGSAGGKNNTTIPVTPPTMSFRDISGHWAEKFIKQMFNMGLMSGVSDTEFAPDENVTRAMLTAILYRLENTPFAAKAKFADVIDGAWYANAVSWASEKGIASGISETEFAPDMSITREQAAAMLYRYMKFKNFETDVLEDTDISTYEDAENISAYAEKPMRWAVGFGLVSGISDTELSPFGNTTRAQLAVLIVKLVEKTK